MNKKLRRNMTCLTKSVGKEVGTGIERWVSFDAAPTEGGAGSARVRDCGCWRCSYGGREVEASGR